jgi:hypothetical protein
MQPRKQAKLVVFFLFAFNSSSTLSTFRYSYYEPQQEDSLEVRKTRYFITHSHNTAQFHDSDGYSNGGVKGCVGIEEESLGSCWFLSRVSVVTGSEGVIGAVTLVIVIHGTEHTTTMWINWAFISNIYIYTHPTNSSTSYMARRIKAS